MKILNSQFSSGVPHLQKCDIDYNCHTQSHRPCHIALASWCVIHMVDVWMYHKYNLCLLLACGDIICSVYVNVVLSIVCMVHMPAELTKSIRSEYGDMLIECTNY